MAAAGDGADGKMDRRTAADGNGRICESLVISTSEGGQTYYMTISRTDPFSVPALDVIDRNVNMQTTFEINGWPQRTLVEMGNWHHSDFDFVAYPFTHLLFDTIVNDANLQSP
jgi:hypothetical protein